MRLAELLLGARKFANELELRKAVEKCEFFDAGSEDIDTARLLLIFKTSTQKSWLCFTKQKIYFILDDLREKLPEVRWRRVRDHIVEGQRITLDLKLQDVSEKTGRVSIGRMNKGFLYTKALFQADGIKKQIYELIEEQMLE